MKISKIEITNYRGINDPKEIPLSNFSSIVGQNDSGKSIILNAVASFLNPKDYPITNTDFNNPDSPISIVCTFSATNLADKLESAISKKIKKSDGLDELIADLVENDQITIKKMVNAAKKSFDTEEILMMDYESDDFSFLYGKNDAELTTIIDDFTITVPAEGVGRNSKLEKIKYIKEYCNSQGIDRRTRFINDDFKLCSLLPDV